MTRTRPTTNWTRDRFTFGITDVNGAVLTMNGNMIVGITDTNPLTTSWS